MRNGVRGFIAENQIGNLELAPCLPDHAPSHHWGGHEGESKRDENARLGSSKKLTVNPALDNSAIPAYSIPFRPIFINRTLVALVSALSGDALGSVEGLMH